MHQRLLVTFDKENAKNSEEARDYVYDKLSADDSFAGEGGRFGSPIADWFVIGGRCSGELSEKTWAKEVVEKIHALEKKEDISIAGTFYGGGENGKKQGKLRVIAEKMYQEAMPKAWKDKNLVYDRFVDRREYDEYGAEDDAMVVTEELYNALLKDYKGEEEVNGYGLEFVDLEYEPVSKKFIGKKWVVVVDYHS